MKYLALLAVYFPLIALAQPKVERWVIGTNGHFIDRTFQCDDIAWKIVAMDEGTSMGISKSNLYLGIDGAEGGLISIGGGCRNDGPPSEATAASVVVTAPVNIMRGTIVNVMCPPGRFIYIDRLIR